MPKPSNDPSELIAAIVALLRPQAVFSKLVTGAGRWAVRYARYDDPGFCLLLHGGCFLDVDGLRPVELEAGDLRKLGVTVEESGEQVVVKPVETALEKLVKALLKDAQEDVHENN